jgi:integrase
MVVSHTENFSSGVKGEFPGAREPQQPSGPRNGSDQLYRCPKCGSDRLNKNGFFVSVDGFKAQKWLCRNCGCRFNEQQNDYIRKRTIPNGRVCVVLQDVTKNMTPETDAKTVLEGSPKLDLKGKLVQFAWHMEKQGKAAATIKTNTGCLRALMTRGANLLDPESVKETIAREKAWSPNRKRNVINAYHVFIKTIGIVWEKPKCTVTRGIPFIPTEAEIDALVAGCSTRVATFLQLLKETAMRSGEAVNLEWIDLDTERRILTLNKPEKGSLPRQWNKLSQKLWDMLSSLPKQDVRVFGPGSLNSLKANFTRSRARLSFKLQNPRLKQIHFHTLRHWRATLEYHNTQDLLQVRDFLGHRCASNTEIYVQLDKTIFQNQDQGYITKIAHSVQEAARLVEVGFEYVTGEYQDGGKLFRKRRWTT